MTERKLGQEQRGDFWLWERGRGRGELFGVDDLQSALNFMKVIEWQHGEVNAMERCFITYNSRGKGVTPRHTGPRGEAPGLVRRERQEWGGEVEATAFIEDFCSEDMMG